MAEYKKPFVGKSRISLFKDKYVPPYNEAVVLVIRVPGEPKLLDYTIAQGGVYALITDNEGEMISSWYDIELDEFRKRHISRKGG